MNKKCSVIITFLVLVIAAGVYKFIFQGSVSVSKRHGEGDRISTKGWKGGAK